MRDTYNEYLGISFNNIAIQKGICVTEPEEGKKKSRDILGYEGVSVMFPANLS